MEPLSIFIGDRHAAVRRGLRAVLDDQPHWQVTGEASSAAAAVEAILQHPPDVALLSTGQSEYGFRAARQIRAEAPRMVILLLTLDDPEPLAAAARRAGADGVVVKYRAESVIASIRAAIRPAQDVHIAGSPAGAHRHIGAFFSSAEERYRILAPFLAEGLKYGDRTVQVIADDDTAAHRAALAEAGVDVERASSQEQLTVQPWQTVYVRNGRLNEEASLHRIGELLRPTAVRRSPVTRLVGNMDWAADGGPPIDGLIEFESRVNRLVATHEDDVIVCTYDLSRFTASFIVDAMRAHPAIVVAGALHANPFYAPPEVLIAEARGRGGEGGH